VYDASGQVVREIVEPFTTRLCAATEYTYDGYGNRSTAQPRNCNGTAIPGVGNEAAAPAATDLASFSMGGLSQRYDYPGAAGATARTITSTNVLGHQNVETLDPRFGTTLSVTDANGLITKVRYDGLGGMLFTLDNRRLLVFSQAGQQVPFRMATQSEIEKEFANKFSTTSAQGWDQFITVRP